MEIWQEIIKDRERGALGDVSASADLEARARTTDDSDGIALRSDKYRATMIIFR